MLAYTMYDYWIASDTHFLHQNIIAFCGRPDDHNERMREALMRLTPDSVLIHLGDVCMGRDEEVHQRFIMPLKCRKILVRGNHDSKSTSWYLSHGWDMVCERLEVRQNGKKVIMTHVPLPDSEIGEGELNLHGHWHNRVFRAAEFMEQHGSYDVLRHSRFAMELTGYEPRKLGHIIDNPVEYRVNITQ